MYEQELHDAIKKHEQLKKEDEEKTLGQILGFESPGRSIIKRNILYFIKKMTMLLGEDKKHKGRGYSEKDVARWAMYISNSRWYDYELALCFVNISDWDYNLTTEMGQAMASLRQTMEMWANRLTIKEGKIVNSWDIEKDGFPSTSRGALCYLFTPVTELPEDLQPGDKINLVNPKKRRGWNAEDTYKILRRKDDGMTMYEATTGSGEKIFLCDRKHIEEAWDCLYDVNKEIYSGWWNRTLNNRK